MKRSATSTSKNKTLVKRIAAGLPPGGQRKIKIQAADGFVTLKGSVRTFREKERLHRFVMGLSGVRALKDLLRIAPEESIADRQIALHIRHVLDAHSELPSGTAVAHVHNGVATLNGHVRSGEERFIAENAASHCRGVKRVVNLITVDRLEEISDEAAARVVRRALEYCEDFETQRVTVACADGGIVLRGEVPTLLDRTLAEEVARIQAGVRYVENNIQVRVPERVQNNGAARKKKS